jgi:hypothetical protein
MFDVGDKVSVRLYGESYNGVVRKVKWGMAYVDFEGKHTNEWLGINRLEKRNEVHDKDRR